MVSAGGRTAAAAAALLHLCCLQRSTDALPASTKAFLLVGRWSLAARGGLISAAGASEEGEKYSRLGNDRDYLDPRREADSKAAAAAVAAAAATPLGHTDAIEGLDADRSQSNLRRGGEPGDTGATLGPKSVFIYG